MSDVDNLINLSLDENGTNSTQLQLLCPLSIEFSPSEIFKIKENSQKYLTDNLDSINCDNNPFDKVYTEANLPDDPFEQVSQRAAATSCLKNSQEVLTENILKLNEEENDQEIFNRCCTQVVTSSPTKKMDTSYDDIMSIKPNWIDTTIEDIESDLESMNIPYLTTVNENVSTKLTSLSGTSEETSKSVNCNESLPTVNIPKDKMLDLESLKQRIKEKKGSNAQDVTSLLFSLKKLVLECSSEEKKAEANELFQSLSNILEKSTIAKEEKTNLIVPAPQPIVRQGTFDIDIKNNELDLPIVEESGATYRASNDDESENISSNIDEVEPSELNEIVQQIETVLGGKQNVSIVQTITNRNGPNTSFRGQHSNHVNPTYIVVVGSTTPRRSPMTDEENEVSNYEMRRRSKSLSLYGQNFKSNTALISPTETQNANQNFKTPQRNTNLSRRNSISTTPRDTVPLTSREISKRTSMDKSLPPLRTFTQTSIISNKRSVISDRNSIKSIKPDKIQLRVNDQAQRTRGPIKATVPLKRLSTVCSTPVIHNNKQLYSNTPLATKASFSSPYAKKLSSSPTRNSYKKILRYSTTPNSKKDHLAAQTAQMQRRSFADNSSSPRITSSVGKLNRDMKYFDHRK